MVASGTAVVIWRVGVISGKSEPRPTAVDAKKPDKGMRPVPQKAEHQEAARWHAELRAYAGEWRGYLAGPYSRAEKLLRCSEFVEVLSRAISQARGPEETATLVNILDQQKEILTSLADPEETIARAWEAFRDGRLLRAISLLELIVVNSDYACPDVEIVLAYWQAKEGSFEASLARLRQVSELESYRNKDLAAYLVAWCYMEQARLQEARTTLEEFLTAHATSPFSEVAEQQLKRLLPVTKPADSKDIR